MTKAARRWRIAPDSAPHPLVIVGRENAYEQARIYAERGDGVTVERWQGGEWKLFERIDAAESPVPAPQEDQ